LGQTQSLEKMRNASASASAYASNEGIVHRTDLDGLRALAVLPVVLFHFDFFGFGGGFVGVDIFFVISGYLITSIIVADLRSGNFSFARFYERRIRRIIPAFTVMLVGASIASIALFPPKELAQFGLSAAAAAAFYSNIFFAFRTNYFSGSENMMPLLHTWSLAVEEQFYIVWPLMLFACYRIGSRLAVSVLVVALAAASLAYSEGGTTAKHAAQLFYLPQSRAWELMIGALLALGMVPSIGTRWLRDGLALLGVGMIAFAVTQFSPTTPFPGLWATIPCLGAMLVIQTGQHRDTAVYGLLSLRPFVFVGLISYSLYLCHWPIFVFAENYTGRPLNLGEDVVLIIVSIAIATASWRYVEQPFRYGRRKAIIAERASFLGGLGALTLVACIGFAIYLGDGLPWRFGPETLQFYLASRDHNALRPDCLDEGGYIPTASRCTAPPSKVENSYDVIVWGDSHGDALFPAIAMIGQNYGFTTRQVTRKGCPPLLGAVGVAEGLSSSFGTSCEKHNTAMLQELQKGPRPRLAVLVARWSMYAETTMDLAGGPRVFLIDNEHQNLDIGTSREVLSRALGSMVDAITALGIPVLLIGQVPEFFQDPNTCFMERAMSQRDVSVCLRLPRQLADQRLRASKGILLEVASGRSATTYVGLDSILCDQEICWAKDHDKPLYEDTNHLNLWGARFVGRTLLQTPSLKRLFVPQDVTADASIHHLGN
jgi:peptidoglycan/LPS O-acetylase OafA/YrhL